jgi:hypothetical protein
MIRYIREQIITLIVSHQRIMTDFGFKVRYQLEYLEIKNNPLFSHIRAYLCSQGDKKFIAESN